MAAASVAHSHRKAYSAHRTMSPAVKAANVARSIAQRRTEGRPWTWAEYGVAGQPCPASPGAGRVSGGGVVMTVTLTDEQSIPDSTGFSGKNLSN